MITADENLAYREYARATGYQPPADPDLTRARGEAAETRVLELSQVIREAYVENQNAQCYAVAKGLSHILDKQTRILKTAIDALATGKSISELKERRR